MPPAVGALDGPAAKPVLAGEGPESKTLLALSAAVPGAAPNMSAAGVALDPKYLDGESGFLPSEKSLLGTAGALLTGAGAGTGTGAATEAGLLAPGARRAPTPGGFTTPGGKLPPLATRLGPAWYPLVLDGG